MSKIALALKYRPKTFDDVVEQDAVKVTLRHQIETDTIKNCYLFTGPAGTGKTSNSRIFANEINGENCTIIELDAASNNGVDDVRRIIEQAKYKSLDSKYKTFIIDECHMITPQGWAAFLKVIEEPPANALFIFATTDAQKIPNTILSRVQRYDFKKISFDGVVNRLKYIIEQENKDNAGITYDKSAIEYIAKLADGGMRDAVTTLDKCISYNNNLTLDNVVKALGGVDYDVMFNLAESIYDFNASNAIKITETIYMSGANIKQFVKDFSNFVLDLCKYGLLGSFEYLYIPSLYEDRMKKYTNEHFTFFNQFLGELIKLNNTIKWESNPKPVIESTFVLLCQKS